MEPFVSIILPIRNEARHISKALASVLAQDYPSECMEVLIVDGQSTDGTRDVINTHLETARSSISVRILDNPGLIVPVGMNIATRQAKGDILIRVDGHCEIDHDYVSKCVEHLQNDAVDGVGGAMRSIGEGYIGEAVAIGMSSPFGVGNSAFRTSSGVNMLVDTVPFPAYTRKIVERVGLYDEEMVRSQDSEYNYRIREVGGRLLLADDVHSTYTSRTSLRRLWRQYFQYGVWKFRVLQKHPGQLCLRQLVPPLFILVLLVSFIVGVVSIGRAAVGDFSKPLVLLLASIIPLLYSVGNLSVSMLTSARKGWRYLPILPLVFSILHIAFGIGFILGAMKFASRWGDRAGKVPDWAPARSSPGGNLVPVHPAHLPGSSSRLLKRLFDLAASFVGLLLLSPLFGFLALRIHRESPGPVFYRDRRVGRGGHLFELFKFRTLPGQSDGILPDAHSRPVTPLGAWLRDSQVDELPQLWNVLKGEMSLVGPRPELPEVVRTWPVEARTEILSLRPGITSPASILYREGRQDSGSANVMDRYMRNVTPGKVRLDQLYVRSRTFLGDLDLIFSTLAFWLPQARNTSHTPEVLFNGRLSRLVRRYITWFMIDCLVAFFAVSGAGLLWRMGQPLHLGLDRAIPMAFLMALIFSMVNTVRGLGRLSWRFARPAYAFDLILSSGITTLGAAAMNWFWPQSRFFPQGMVVVAGLLAFLGFLTVRYRHRLLTGLAWRWLVRREGKVPIGERVLIVGAGDCGLLANWLLTHSSLASLFTVVGMVDDDPSKLDMTVDNLSVLGMMHLIPQLVEEMDIGVILFAIEKIHPEEQTRILEFCSSSSVRLVMVPDLFQLFMERFTPEDTPRPRPAREQLTGMLSLGD